MAARMLPNLPGHLAAEVLPAAGVALKPQLQVILVKSLSFEAEQLMRGSGETPRKGILEVLAPRSRTALGARVAFVSHAFAFFVLRPPLQPAVRAAGIPAQSGCRTPGSASPEGHLCSSWAQQGQKAGF